MYKYITQLPTIKYLHDKATDLYMLPLTVCILTIILGGHVKNSLIRPLSENLVISESMVQKTLGCDCYELCPLTSTAYR